MARIKMTFTPCRMKTKSPILISLVILILSATGCTIEKRLFQPGYSIEWKKKIRQKSKSEATDLLSVKTEEPDSTWLNTFVDESPVKEGFKTGGPVAAENSNPETADQQKLRDTPISNPVESQETVSTTAPKELLGIPDPEPQKELEIFGTVSFGLYFCSLALGIYSLFALNALPVIVIACLMILLSFTFGIISVIRYRKDKSRYYRNFFGYFGLIASAVTIFWTAFLLLFAWGLDSF